MKNLVILIGNLGQDPDTRYTTSGNAIVNLSVATSHKWKDKQGNWQEETEWHRVVVFGKAAERVGAYKKGDRVGVEGRIKTNKWTDQNGQDRYQVEIVARTILGLGSRTRENGDLEDGKNTGNTQGKGKTFYGYGDAGKPPQQKEEFENYEDDIPF